MLEYDRIDGSKGTDVSKSNGLREYIISHYWYFPEINFRFQLKVCNGCHDLAMSFNDIAIVPVKRNDYRIHFWLYYNIIL